MKKIQNISAYKFATLTDLKLLRTKLLTCCKEWSLKGTILISTEGINLFVAGPPEKVDSLLTLLRAVPGLEALEVKSSVSDHQPFNRMLVRIKKEIIAFGVEGIEPGRRTSPKLSASTLKEWLDSGKPVTLLDTRNDYEVKLGTFKGALPLGISNFRQFPSAVRKLPESMKEQPIVMFCTGGIRCEKAGPFMEREGFRNIFQLEGGILKYFEECGGAHYDGECFVFDQRVGVDPSLHETESAQCFQCLTPLSEAEQQDERYVAGKSCPYCFKTSEQQLAFNLEARHEAIQRVTTPLPGTVPYDNFRPLTVPHHCDGKSLIEFLGAILPHVPSQDWEELCEAQLLVNHQKEPVTKKQPVRAGERYYQKLPNIVEPDINPDIRVLHEDEALIVLNKPAPLPMHPGGRFNRNTLQYILNEVYYPQKPHPAHRLDANTSGVTLVTRTRHFAARLQPQFANGEIHKWYLARVAGHPGEEQFECNAPISAEPGELGSRQVDSIAGLPARTLFRVIRKNRDGSSLVEAQPLTGRTNQIRVHLWQLGFPIVGDPVYLSGGKLGDTQTLRPESPPLCLHSWRISFMHPLTFVRTEFTAPAPSWAQL
ncbi:MAG: sulfurtransferase [Verrucomicrobiota bacterium]|nr:sulfurtransferase [Verrucomicrobiota bacterium]